MSNRISQGLMDEQDAIINSNSKKMIILAGPGSGKTYTIIKKAKKELSKLKFQKINKGIILCSFTNEATFELKKKLENHLYNDFSFVGTLDSFIFKIIINPFKNRILRKIDSSPKVIRNKLTFSKPSLRLSHKTQALTREGYNKNNKGDIFKYSKYWIKNFISGRYEISFPTYLFSELALNELVDLRSYLEARFSSMYIDEAQDLNTFQMKVIKKMIEVIDINCYLVGDKRQSIYSFRGAKPELFYSMRKEPNFNEYLITHSARCHYNILEFSRRIVGENQTLSKLENNGRVKINYSILDNLESLNNINNYFILVETNIEAQNLYTQCLRSEITNIIYSRRMELNKNKDFSDNYYQIIEEILKFFFNHKNKNPKLTYSIENLIDLLERIIDTKKINQKKFSINEDNFINYLKKIFFLGKIKIPEKVLDEISEQVNQDIYKNHYIRYSKKNRIMTIHSSKGLEAEQVFLNFTRKRYKVDEEMKRKLFVAFTRAKNKLFIGFNGTDESKLEKYINDIFERTFIY